MSSAVAVCGRLYDSRGDLGEGCLIVEDEKIVKIKKDIDPSSSLRRYDFRGKGLILTPAFIDLHVHLRGLNLSYKEDEYSGTRAALSSGILLVVDMPNTSPRLETVEAVNLKLKSLEGKAVTDYGVYAAVPKDSKVIKDLLKAPIAGFKIYPEDIKERLNVIEYLSNITTSRLIVLHPELPEALSPVIENESSRGLHRGCHMEASAVSFIKNILTKARLHITHASCPATVREAKALGATVDVTPHHIFYNNWSEGCLWRVNPPLRSEDMRHSLLNILLFSNLVDAIVSDHAPHRPSEKVDPLSCMSGFAWLEAWPWLVFKLVHIGSMSFSRFLYLLTLGPAQILGLEEKYGILKEGYRANLILIDPSYRWRFYGSLSSKDPHLHLFMKELRGRVTYAFLGGALVLDEGECYCDEANKRKVNAFK